MSMRFDYCPDVNGTWAVIDLVTGKPAFVNGRPVIMVDLERAEAIAALLNRQKGFVARGGASVEALPRTPESGA